MTRAPIFKPGPFALTLAWLLIIHMMLLASSVPVVRHLGFSSARWPAAAPSLRLVLLSDTHMTAPETTPARLRRVVAQVNALSPDIVLLAGDYAGRRVFSTRHYGVDQAIAPFAGLRPRIASFAVLGNHDQWRKRQTRAALERAGVRLLWNDAARVGPLAIGGLGDKWSGDDDVPRVLAALRGAGGLPILLSHNPDDFAHMPSDIALMLAGHTHCGQIVLPFWGAIDTASAFGARYRCGVVAEHGAQLVVTAGIGTSLLPFRLGAPPDLWVIDIGPMR